MSYKAYRRPIFCPTTMTSAQLKDYIRRHRGSYEDRDRVTMAQCELLARHKKLEIDSNVLDSNYRGPRNM